MPNFKFDPFYVCFFFLVNINIPQILTWCSYSNENISCSLSFTLLQHHICFCFILSASAHQHQNTFLLHKFFFPQFLLIFFLSLCVSPLALRSTKNEDTPFSDEFRDKQLFCRCILHFIFLLKQNGITNTMLCTSKVFACQSCENQVLKHKGNNKKKWIYMCISLSLSLLFHYEGIKPILLKYRQPTRLRNMGSTKSRLEV